MDYNYVEYTRGGGDTWAPIVKTVELNLDNYIDVIWAPERGPYSEVVDGCLRRTPAGIKALRDELNFYINLGNSPKERNKMNDKVVEQTENLAVISDVKHYAIERDENGNEVRREISQVDFEKEFKGESAN